MSEHEKILANLRKLEDITKMELTEVVLLPFRVMPRLARDKRLTTKHWNVYFACVGRGAIETDNPGCKANEDGYCLRDALTYREALNLVPSIAEETEVPADVIPKLLADLAEWGYVRKRAPKRRIAELAKVRI